MNIRWLLKPITDWILYGDHEVDPLRRSVTRGTRQYAKVYGTHDLGESPNPVPPQVPLRVADELAGQEQRADVERARQQFGFWHCASTVDHITRLYLQRRQTYAR